MNNSKHEAGKLLCFHADGNNHILINPNFPLSSKYNPEWVFKNEIRSNTLWFTKWLIQKMDLKSGINILDMNCGKFFKTSFLLMNFINNLISNYLEVDKWISGNIMI